MSRTDSSPTQTLWGSWNRFFFSETRLDSLALIRMLLCGVLLIPVASRWPHAREIYSSDGVITPLSAGFPGSTELPVLNGAAAVSLYTALVFFLVTGLIGWRTRLSLGLAAALLIYFGLLDLISTLTKYTVIASHMLAVLAFSRCGDVWSVDAWLRREPASGRGAIWPIRVIQLFLAILYFATAVTKVKSPEFMSGEHTVFWMQTNMNHPHTMGYWLSMRPELVVFSSYLVVLWETVFCALCWNRRTLVPLLGLGIAFHLATYSLLGLAVFPLIMLSLYPAFVPPEKVRSGLMSLRVALSAKFAGLPAARIVAYSWAFPIVLGVTLVTAIEAEYHLDPMHERSSKPALPIIATDVANARLESSGPTSPAEWVYRVDVGNRSVAGVVGGESSVFQPDATVQLQMWYHSPHPDFYVHIDVHDESDQPIMQDGTIVTREQHRSTVPFSFANHLRPGNYTFVFRDSASLIARHPFQIVE